MVFTFPASGYIAGCSGCPGVNDHVFTDQRMRDEWAIEHVRETEHAVVLKTVTGYVARPPRGIVARASTVQVWNLDENGVPEGGPWEGVAASVQMDLTPDDAARYAEAIELEEIRRGGEVTVQSAMELTPEEWEKIHCQLGLCPGCGEEQHEGECAEADRCSGPCGGYGCDGRCAH